MSPAELTLWNRIQDFGFDQPGTSFKFSDRVARENGWTKRFALRVIDEYKKFIFLCCVSEKGVTPSDAVDQVWHLHLTYTRSYWIDFCRHTLGKEVHHNPTKGGRKEAEKFDVYYSRLKELYQQYFTVVPPDDIWKSNDVRFSDIHFQRINLTTNWIIPKPGVKVLYQFSLLVAGIFGLLFIQAADNSLAVAGVIFIFIVFIYNVIVDRKNRNGNGGTNGCSAGGCGSDSHHSGHDGCSGSGCSSSGCSGCGGGD